MRHPQCLFLLGAVVLAPALHAADAPMRKPGLWEVRTETRAGAPGMPGPMTMQMCIEQGKDDMTADSGDAREMRKRCSKMDVKRSGKTTTIDSVCTMDGHTATGRTVISGNMATEYRMENTTHFNPPMPGMQTMSSVQTGKWIGPCKPGQQHGSVSMPGMGPGGEFRMDAETMKRLQQQYGR
ncbi:MAG: DUF3617 family protein [Thiobacillus sp.]|nr:DUF3617 family protein [Thiobacillus sp.]